jgi:hypothetical protein
MVENLKTASKNNGDLFGTTSPPTMDITSDTIPKFQWTYDGLECSVDTYGRFYAWFPATDINV